MKENNNSREATGAGYAVARTVAAVVRACACTLAWLAVVAVIVLTDSVAVADVLFLTSVLALAVLGLLFAGSAKESKRRRIVGYLLPVYGDLSRCKRRRERKLGNRLVRELGLAAQADARDHRVYWDKRSNVLEIERLPVHGLSPASLDRHVGEGLAVADAADYVITDHGINRYTVKFLPYRRIDRLLEDHELARLPVLGTARGLSVAIGRDLDGKPAKIQFANISGCLLGGNPGTGKTGAATLIMAPLLASPLVDCVILDGKGGDWSWAEPAAKRYCDDENDDMVLGILRGLVREMRRRTGAMKEETGRANFWETPVSATHRPIVLMVDECQAWLEGSERAKPGTPRAEILAMLTTLVKKGRSAGIIVILATQRPTVDSVPSKLRGVCSLRFCFWVPDTDGARAVMGVLPPDSASPVQGSMPRVPGLCVRDAGNGFGYVRFDHLDEARLQELVKG